VAESRSKGSERRRIALTERVAIDTLARVFGKARGRGIAMGIGDDAAILRDAGSQIVWSIDSSIEGTHFERDWLSLGEAAGRALAAAVSDLSAMGARPVAALCALGVPHGTTKRDFTAIAAGQRKIAERAHCPIIGGDIARAERLSFTTTVLGRAEEPLTRRGARPGDEIWLLGTLGEAAMGLRALQVRASATTRAAQSAIRACVKAWRQPPLLLREGQRLVGRASAALDVSDGLALDASRIAAASQVGLVIDQHQLEQAASAHLLRACSVLGVDPVEAMLHGGEDYALLATGKPARRPRGVRVIGRVTRGEGAWLLEGITRRRLERGFDHLASGP
jgi:thiamine-monophosphate kinase